MTQKHKNRLNKGYIKLKQYINYFQTTSKTIKEDIVNT